MGKKSFPSRVRQSLSGVGGVMHAMSPGYQYKAQPLSLKQASFVVIIQQIFDQHRVLAQMRCS